MMSLTRAWVSFAADECGATAIEYVVIAGALTLALVPGFYYVSSAMQVKFEDLISAVNAGS